MTLESLIDAPDMRMIKITVSWSILKIKVIFRPKSYLWSLQKHQAYIRTKLYFFFIFFRMFLFIPLVAIIACVMGIVAPTQNE